MTIDTPVIKAGTAKIAGRIISPNGTINNNVFINITVPHPISGEYAKYKALVDGSGKFSIDVDVETDISLIGIYPSLNPEKSLLVKLTNGGVTNIDIAYNSDFDIEKIDVRPDMNKNDMTRGFEVMGKMIEYRSGRKPEPLYNKSTEYFLNYARTIVTERLEIVKNDTLISKELKEILSKDFRLFLFKAHVFDYEEYMTGNYRNTNDDKSKKPDIQKIDRSYYRFLKDFNFNDPQYLNCFTFLEVQKAILQNEILDLPVIGDSDIPSWLASVKAILSDLVGFDNGPYYEILAANAYARQLNEEVKPLTAKQKENIANYWKNGEIAKILFRKNQQVAELDKFKSPVVVNDISSVPADKVIETIVAKHKGKVVFIDLWATWCTPCLNAMQEFRTAKNDFRDKDVAFVYITDGSSPRKLWEEKIKGIGSEHYYLTAAQWDYIMDHFGFEYIPSYLLYNKEGMLVKKITAFPGNEEVKKVINGLL
ncbi:Thioredoxin-like [Pedobacter steynii]|uniref:Thioredoxin-like n=1 Tax=Pedobacter steynii TaxID=430522 RepID=A0A1H0JPP4_9SPHI|nr:TlpA disulfide reductase family protein [Pedobacter steynii]NQX43125.1 TlpA family protein disulfide reductase [Pedobacter steynii]SDO45544.1 Thioredoxin-like [Pedobacter steynii]